MDRRSWIARLAAGLAGLMLWPRRLVAAEPKEQASLEERLKSGLKCRRSEEFDFVATVADRVNTGQIPEALVLQTMKWSVKKNSKFPFFYFQTVIFRQAEALGVDLGDPVQPINP